MKRLNATFWRGDVLALLARNYVMYDAVLKIIYVLSQCQYLLT